MKLSNYFSRRSVSAVFAAFILTLVFSPAAFAQTTAFTYQGRLTDSQSPNTSSYLMKFELYSDAAGNTLPIDTLTDIPVSVANGVFTAQLNFGQTGGNVR